MVKNNYFSGIHDFIATATIRCIATRGNITGGVRDDKGGQGDFLCVRLLTAGVEGSAEKCAQKWSKYHFFSVIKSSTAFVAAYPHNVGISG